ncbi:hypothetical protein DWV00_29765 [Trinickia dinghuensis]|uniref:Uncharacterized protein n=1 Tax=Trinickia dinghuensis TaxID=2291023 RepID=A0A3D8JR42_9BURK|nr:hypothetical protein DWV00_29765 [Trinickia dinghuensis]
MRFVSSLDRSFVLRGATWRHGVRQAQRRLPGSRYPFPAIAVPRAVPRRDRLSWRVVQRAAGAFMLCSIQRE